MRHYHSLSFFRNLFFQQYAIIFLEADKNDSAKKSFLRIRARTSLLALFLFALFGTKASGQTQVFLENFNRTTLTSEAPTTYSISITAGDGSAGINTGTFLELTNDVSGTANGDGIVYVSGVTQNFVGTYNQTLHANTGNIEWMFNFRYNRTSHPSGLTAGSYGTAIILAASNEIFSGTGAGNGYAIVFGSSGTPDPIRLVKYAGGVSGTISNIISSGINDISTVNNYVSVRVIYEPVGDYWSLFVRDDGASGWSDPSVGVTSQKGTTASDNTYTSISLTHFGFYWAYATASAQTSQFDNFGVTSTLSTTPTITVNTSSLPSFGNISVGNFSDTQNITVRGTNLTDNIVLSPPTGFELRIGTNLFSQNPISLVQTNGVVADTTIDVRFSPANAYSFSGNITCTSSGATTRNIAVTGVGVSTGLELFLTSDLLNTDSSHAVIFPHAGMGTVYGADDWTYNSLIVTFYVVPTGSHSFGASEFEINWDAVKANLTVTNGNMFDFFATQDISAGKMRINAGASSNLNAMPSPGKYLTQLNVEIIQPGSIGITMTGTDFRYFDGDAQENLQVTTHTGSIKYYLGDFASQNNVTASGDGKINFEDLVQFALAYFSESDGVPVGYKAKFDIGPTNSVGSYFAMPNPDGHIQFEDLAIFSIGYGKTAALQLPKENVTPVVFGIRAQVQNAGGMIRIPLSISGSYKNVHAVSVSLYYPSSSLEYIGFEKSGGMNHDYCFMAAQAKENTVLFDAAVMGTEHEGVSEEGIFAYLVFKQRYASKKYEINIQSAIARDNNNRDIKVLISPMEILASDVPDAFGLSQNYPNPFNPSTTIEYQLPAVGSRFIVTLKVYDILGRDVAILVSQQQDAGYYRVEWNGKNTHHQPVSSGIYFCQMRAVDCSSVVSRDFVAIRKMLLLK